MEWLIWLVATPVRFLITCAVVAALVSFFWPGVVAHFVWVLLSVAVEAILDLLWELKWLLLGLGLVGAAYFSYHWLL